MGLMAHLNPAHIGRHCIVSNRHPLAQRDSQRLRARIARLALAVQVCADRNKNRLPAHWLQAGPQLALQAGKHGSTPVMHHAPACISGSTGCVCPWNYDTAVGPNPDVRQRRLVAKTRTVVRQMYWHYSSHKAAASQQPHCMHLPRHVNARIPSLQTHGYPGGGLPAEQFPSDCSPTSPV